MSDRGGAKMRMKNPALCTPQCVKNPALGCGLQLSQNLKASVSFFFLILFFIFLTDRMDIASALTIVSALTLVIAPP